MNFGTGTFNIKSSEVSRSVGKIYDRKTDRFIPVGRKIYIYITLLLCYTLKTFEMGRANKRKK